MSKYANLNKFYRVIRNDENPLNTTYLLDNNNNNNNIHLNHLHITKSNYTQGRITNNNTEWNIIQCKGK